MNERVFPVGRLDKDTEGLLLLTNDGEVTYKLTHPKYEIAKAYVAQIRGVVSNEDIKTLEQGVILEDGITSPAKVKILKNLHDSTIIEIKIHEGEIDRLVNVLCYMSSCCLFTKNKNEKLSLKDLKIGKWRYLNQRK